MTPLASEYAVSGTALLDSADVGQRTVRAVVDSEHWSKAGGLIEPLLKMRRCNAPALIGLMAIDAGPPIRPETLENRIAPI